ncbi:MAG: MarR family winged helix-turn-helix transcriptional regulator [Rhodanobacter sp.]|jgi:DNA-binding MarR family transcriptional regulator
MDPGGTRMNMLSERAGMTKQSMAYPVEGLREPGYLTVVADPAERRAKLVRLTRRDSKKVETLVALSKQFEDWLAGAMSAANMKRLRTLLEQAAGVLERRGQG